MKTSAATCPTCGASLPIPDAGRSVVCQYCGTHVLLDGPPPPRPVAPRTGGTALVLVVGGLLVAGGIAAGALVWGVRRPAAPPPPPGSPPPIASTSAPAPPTPLPAASAPAPPSPFARVELEFGEPGTAAGQMKDARAITVDPQGLVYVAEYGGLRIQKFDRTGKYLDTIPVPAGPTGGATPHIAATADGHLWLCRSGDLVKLSLPDGKVVKTIPAQAPKVALVALAVDPAGNVYAENVGATTFVSTDGKGPPRTDDIRKLDKNGTLLAAWKDVKLSSFSVHSALTLGRDGTIYFSEGRRRVHVLDPKGKVKARFDAMGDGGIAVDERGRIYVGGRGISVFDPGGSELGRIGVDDVENLALGPDGRLYAVSRTRVRVFTLL